MNSSMIMLGISLGLCASIGLFFAKEQLGFTKKILLEEDKWLNYPKLEHMMSAREDEAAQTPASCKAFQEHQQHQSLSHMNSGVMPSSSMLWKLKHDELYAHCAVETIEQTIARLQEQLKKDRELWVQAKSEYSKALES
jgi:hypothetical protein